MPFFDLADGRLASTRARRRVSPQVMEQVLEAASEQAIELVGRPLMPISWDNDSVGEEQNASLKASLIALDPAGRVVTIEVYNEFDSLTLVASLARAGCNLDYSRADLANLYPGGPEGFYRDWARFVESCPPQEVAPVRLVVIAADIPMQTRPALETLAGAGVEVHELRVEEFAGQVRVELEELKNGWRPLFDRVISPARAKHGLPVSEPAYYVPSYVSEKQYEANDLSEEADSSFSHATTYDSGTSLGRVDLGEFPTPVAESPASFIYKTADKIADSADIAQSSQLLKQNMQIAEGALESVVEVGNISDNIKPRLSRREMRKIAQSGRGAIDDMLSADQLLVPQVSQLQLNPAQVAQCLRAIAVQYGAPVQLAWTQRRRGIIYNATLTAWGTIVTEDGSAWSDPSQAAGHVSGREQVDGWVVWLLPDGRNLGAVL